MSDLLQSMKRVSQRLVTSVADTGAKTMLKTDMVFLERDIKARKQAFGIEVYDILQSNASSGTTGAATISASDIQKAYEVCHADIQHLENKVNSKKREMDNIDQSSGVAGTAGVGGAAGAAGAAGVGTSVDLNSVGMDDEPEAPGIPSTP
mmetsp:Transcript_1568/g.3580  ORF Transcript_1568/g.3580 Transcript_1568/m.3580 type:complete len:150 (-) Transcript_1568:170-619(-)